MSSARWLWRSGRGALNASQAVARRVQEPLITRQMTRVRRVSSGVLGPWDPPPPPNLVGYYDYAGLATPQDIAAAEWTFPLGCYIHPRGKWRGQEPIGISRTVANQHTVVIAPSRSGKTFSVIAPWIHAAMQAGYVVVAVDVKGNRDLIGELRSYAASQPPLGGAPIASWDYRNPDHSLRWDWLAELDSEGAVNAAVEAICGRARDNDPNMNFHLRDMKYLRGLLELQGDVAAQLTVRDLIAAIEDQQVLDSWIRRAPGSRGVSRLRELLALSPYEYGRAVQFVTTHLETLDTDGFVRVTRGATFQLAQLDQFAGGLLVINAPMADQALAAASSGLMLSQIIHRRLQQFSTSPAPMMLVLDEAARLQDRIDLAGLLSAGAGSNLSLLLAVQDVTQFDESRREEILANCGTCIVLPGVSQSSSQYFASRLGKRQRVVRNHSMTYDSKNGAGRTYSSNAELVDVLGHNEISQPPFGGVTGLVHSRRVSAKPVLVDLTR